MIADLAASLRAEARAADERRALVIAGGRSAGYEAAETALEATDIAREDTTLVGDQAALRCEQIAPVHAGRLLGTTRDAVVVDAHDTCPPNVLGRTVGAVDGGGLYVIVAPPLDEWPERRDGFDASLAVPPFEEADVTGRFRERLVETLRAHRGVAVYDADAGEVRDNGLTDPPPRRPRTPPTPPADSPFPNAAFEACLTEDQAEAVTALAALRDPDTAVVVESDRGRGKSAAAGIAAACLAADGRDVAVTAPQYRSAREVFARAESLLASLGRLDDVAGDPPKRLDAGAGVVRYLPVADAADADPDVLLVDEAAALPVRQLESFLDAHPASIVYCWREDCEPCDAVRRHLEDLRERGAIPDGIGLGAIYGPDNARVLSEEYDIGGSPTTLFCSGTRIESRCVGNPGPNGLQREIDLLAEGL